MSTELHLIAIALIIVLVILLSFFYRRSIKAAGTIQCTWYTVQAFVGMGVLLLYIAITGYYYLAKADPRYGELVYLGILFIVYYLIYGRAAIGSLGIFLSGSFVNWNKIDDYIAKDGFRGTTQIQFRWKESETAIGHKMGRIIVPHKYRGQVVEILNSSVKNKNHDV